MKLKIDKKDCLLKDLKIPEGYRLLEDYEVLKEIRTNDELKQLCIDGYVVCKLYDGKTGVSGLNWFDVVSGFNASYGSVGIVGALRGVFTKKEVKQ